MRVGSAARNYPRCASGSAGTAAAVQVVICFAPRVAAVVVVVLIECAALGQMRVGGRCWRQITMVNQRRVRAFLIIAYDVSQVMPGREI